MPSSDTFDPDAPITEPDDPRYEARVIRAFVRKDRLISIPARERKRRVILRFLLDQVLPDESPVLERDLNLRIMRWNPDPSALRRFLVEAKLAQRDGGVYRRAVPISGGPPANDQADNHAGTSGSGTTSGSSAT
jgi:hypothetical protein